MDSENKFWAWLWGLAAIVSVVGISYSTTVALAELGVNPAIIKCMDINWTTTGNHDICKAVLTGAGLSIEETKDLVEKLQE